MAGNFDVKGSMVALITPFHEDGSINFEKLEELLEFHIGSRVNTGASWRFPAIRKKSSRNMGSDIAGDTANALGPLPAHPQYPCRA